MTAGSPSQPYNNASLQLPDDGTADRPCGIDDIEAGEIDQTGENAAL